MATTVDFYSETNSDTLVTVYEGTTVGQSFTSSRTYGLTSVVWYLRKAGTPTGNIYSSIYAHSGVYGTSSVPTGSALATSDAVDISGLTTSLQLITFTFSGSNLIKLNANTYYVVTVTYSSGDSSNFLYVGLDFTTPTASGNNSIFQGITGPWTASNKDYPFYVYGNLVSGPLPMFLPGVTGI